MMTNIEQQPELKTEMNTATDPDAQPTWDANTDLSGFERCDHSQYRSFIQRGSA